MFRFQGFARVCIVILIPALILAGCQDRSGQASLPAQLMPEGAVSQDAELSELQITACRGADNARTCNSRLGELGIIQKEECCAALGLCC